MKVESYKNLIVWKKSMDLAVSIYNLTKLFPKEELYGLTSQIRRASISISSNIAEGSRRGSKKDFRNFLLYAYGSGSELETQIEIAKKIFAIDATNYVLAEKLLDEVMRMLNKFTHELDA